MQMKIAQNAIFLTLFALLPLAFLGQGRIPFLRYTEGISQAQITCLLEGDDNEIWVGTKYGINIFHPETSTFENIDQNPNLRIGHIQDIQTDRTGKVWFATRQGFFSEHGDSIGISHPTPETFPIREFAFDSRNQLLYLTNYQRLIYQFRNGTKIDITNEYPFLLSAKLIGMFWDEKRERLIIWAENNMAYFLGEKIDSVKLIENEVEDHFFRGNDGRLYFATRTTVYEMFETGEYKEVFHVHQGIIDGNHRGMQVDEKGSVYFSQQNTLKKYDGKQIIDYGQKFVGGQYLVVKANNTVFIGTEEGLIEYPGVKFTYWGFEDKVRYPWAVAATTGGDVYYTSFGLGLFKLDKEKGYFLEDSSYVPVLNGLGIRRDHRTFYAGAMRDHTGKLIFPISTFGLLAKDKKGYSLPHKFDSTRTFIPYDIYDDTSNHRYLIASNRLVSLDYNGEYQDIPIDTSLFFHENILGIEKDQLGRFWIGSRRQLAIYDRDTVREVRYPGGGYQLHCDTKGSMWASGKLQGLWVHGQWNGKPRQILQEHLKKFVYFLGSVDSTYLLIGAVDGLYVLNLQVYHKTGKCYAAKFDNTSGLVGRECSQNALFKTNDSVFYFLTDQAIMRLNGNQFKRDMGYPNDTISLRIKDAMEVESGTTLNREGFTKNSFHYFCKNFKFKFDSSPSSAITVRYHLIEIGQSTSLSSTEEVTDGEILLGDLHPGKYRLVLYPQLQSSKFVLAETITFEFEVKTVWAFWSGIVLAVTFVVVILVAFFVIRRIRKLNRKNELTERERELLGLRLIAISSQLKGHFVGNTLGNYQGLIGRLDTKEGQLAIHTLVVALDQMISSVLTPSPFWTLSEELNFVRSFIKIESIRFRTVVETIIGNEVHPFMDHIYVPKTILQSLLENAIEHGGESRTDNKGHVNCSININDDEIILVIQDNGVGYVRMLARRGTLAGIGNKTIKEMFILLNEYRPQTLFDLKVDEIFQDDEVRGTQAVVRMPLGFKYPKI